jgi:F0F1-type ATP synthase assembly protein I
MLSAIPLILAAAPLVGYFIGTKIDLLFGTNRVFMFVFLGLGFVAGVRETIHLVRKAEEDD